MGFLSPVYTIPSPRTVVMLMVTGQKDPRKMAELYSRPLQEPRKRMLFQLGANLK